MRTIISFSILLLLSNVSLAASEYDLQFEGVPYQQVQLNSDGAVAVTLDKKQQAEFKCVISQEEGKFLWASRGDIEMTIAQSGIYTTFVAADGSGYVRIINPSLYGVDESESIDFEDLEYQYIEHLNWQLTPITHYGKIMRWGAGEYKP